MGKVQKNCNVTDTVQKKKRCDRQKIKKKRWDGQSAKKKRWNGQSAKKMQLWAVCCVSHLGKAANRMKPQNHD